MQGAQGECICGWGAVAAQLRLGNVTCGCASVLLYNQPTCLVLTPPGACPSPVQMPADNTPGSHTHLASLMPLAAHCGISPQLCAQHGRGCSRCCRPSGPPICPARGAAGTTHRRGQGPAGSERATEGLGRTAAAYMAVADLPRLEAANLAASKVGAADLGPDSYK